MALKFDPQTGAYYDPDDKPIQISAIPPSAPSDSSSWLWILAALVILAAIKKR